MNQDKTSNFTTRHYLSFLFFFAFTRIVYAQDNQTETIPLASEKPLRMMQELSALEGRWSMTMEIATEDSSSWDKLAPEIVDISYRQKGMILAEVPASLSTPAFHMESYITFDQYREVYRKAAIDDVWGIMDIYEGVRVNDTIVFTNLRSGTTFPIAENQWRNFRLTLEIATPTRTFLVEKSDDSGNSWQPAFRSTYQKLEGH